MTKDSLVGTIFFHSRGLKKKDFINGVQCQFGAKRDNFLANDSYAYNNKVLHLTFISQIKTIPDSIFLFNYRLRSMGKLKYLDLGDCYARIATFDST